MLLSINNIGCKPEVGGKSAVFELNVCKSRSFCFLERSYSYTGNISIISIYLDILSKSIFSKMKGGTLTHFRLRVILHLSLFDCQFKCIISHISQLKQK